MDFPDSGFIRVERAFSPQDAEMMRGVLWATLRREFGMRESEPQTWNQPFRKRPLDDAGSSPLFRAMFSDRLAAALDGLFGEEALWEWPERLGDLLITFPNADAWELPHQGWHRDWVRTAQAAVPPAVKAFAFLSDVGPGGGGTLVVQGSHLLAAREGDSHEIESKQEHVLHDYPWLRALCTPGDAKQRYRAFVEEGASVEGVYLKVVELTGRPGDIVILHPWLLHAIAPNAASTPRFMRAPVISFERLQSENPDT